VLSSWPGFVSSRSRRSRLIMGSRSRVCGSGWLRPTSTMVDGLLVEWRAGRSRITCVPKSWPTRSTLPPGDADHRPVRSRAVTTDRTTAAGYSGNDVAVPVCSARWAPSATPWTTPSPSRSSRHCNANSSTGTPGRAGPGWARAMFHWIEAFYNPTRRLHPRLPQPRRLRGHHRGMIPHPTSPQSWGASLQALACPGFRAVSLLDRGPGLSA
jgi:hypothetical protein